MSLKYRFVASVSVGGRLVAPDEVAVAAGSDSWVVAVCGSSEGSSFEPQASAIRAITETIVPQRQEALRDDLYLDFQEGIFNKVGSPAMESICVP